MDFSRLKRGIRLKGLIPGEIVQIITAEAIGDDALELVFRKKDGSLGQQLISGNKIPPLDFLSGPRVTPHFYHPYRFDAFPPGKLLQASPHHR
jgi:hypothetical protein